MASNVNAIFSSAKSRRSNKPLMEKRRRERINKSLNSIKEIVLVAENKDVSKFSKLEKADILDMTVNHLKTLHEKARQTDKSNDYLKKYKEGFDLCRAELENLLKNNEGLSPDCVSKVISHLKTYSESLTQDSITLSYRGNTHRVKATIDASVLKSDVLTHDANSNSAYVEYDKNLPCTSQEYDHQPVKFEVYIPSWNGLSQNHVFPPSPPDSSRSSSSPDSVRGSPKHICDHQSLSPHGFDSVTSVSYTHSPTSSMNKPSTSNAPLNLSISPITSKDESFEFIHCDIPSMTSSPLTSEIRNLSKKSNFNMSSGSFSNHLLIPDTPRCRLSSGHRPTPYPKKDAVKRYQNQTLGLQIKQESLLNDSQRAHSSSHWRPW